MSIEYKNVLRIIADSKTSLESELDEKMIGAESNTNTIGVKLPGGDMMYAPTIGTDTNFNSVVLGKITPTLDAEAATKKYVDTMAVQNTSSESRITGVVTGGDISRVNSTTIAITAGSGYIVDSYTTPDTPTVTKITWGAQNYVLTGTIGTGDVVYTIFMSSDATPGNSVGFLSEQSRRNNITLGFVKTYNGSIVASNDVLSAPQRTNNAGNMFLSYVYYKGLNNQVKGLSILKANTGLQLYATGGTIFIPNSGDSTEPHVKNIPINGSASSPSTFGIFNKNGVKSTDSTTVPKQWDNNGTLTNLAANKASIHYMFEDAQGRLYLQVGNTEYASYSAAITNLAKDYETFVPYPFFSGAYTLVARIVIGQASTAFGDGASDIFNQLTNSGGGASASSPTISQVLATGNNASGQGITGLAGIYNGSNFVSIHTGAEIFSNTNSTLYSMGNTYVAADDDVVIDTDYGTVRIKNNNVPVLELNSLGQYLTNTTIAQISASSAKQLITKEYLQSYTQSIGSSDGYSGLIQMSNGNGGFVRSDIFAEAPDNDTYDITIGDSTVNSKNVILRSPRDLVLMANGSNGSSTADIKLYASNVDLVAEIFNTDSTTSGGCMILPESTSTKIGNIGNKAVLTREYGDSVYANKDCQIFSIGRSSNVTIGGNAGVGIPNVGDGSTNAPRGFIPCITLSQASTAMFKGIYYVNYGSALNITVQLRYATSIPTNGLTPNGGTLIAQSSYTTNPSLYNGITVTVSGNTSIPSGSYVWINVVDTTNGFAQSSIGGAIKLQNI